MNYRKLYEEHYGIKIPSDFSIHHIDWNRENNKIKNLILLPRGLHEQVHLICNTFYHWNGKELPKLLMDPHRVGFYKEWFKLLAETAEELMYWTAAKELEDLTNGENKYNFMYSYNNFRSHDI